MMGTVIRRIYRLPRSSDAARIWLAVTFVLFAAIALITVWSMTVHMVSGCEEHDILGHGGAALKWLWVLVGILVGGAGVTCVVRWRGPETRSAMLDTKRTKESIRLRMHRPAIHRLIRRLCRSVSADDDPVPVCISALPRILTALTPRLRFIALRGGFSCSLLRQRSTSGRLLMLPPGRAPVVLPART